ncbi:MAG: type I-C CRISPR-associated endonuclease Cas1c [Chloroflexota bacterium]|nr:type I-C CRISPR-associated endonuclease Cas1c [Dehalococcoidia bacterium]MDW8255287.1 type I-C CRISPR-associated endonuclease Cas1c [Chloroflexota bacterium]
MRELLNTLFVQTEGAYLSLDQDTVRVEIDGTVKLRAPLLNLGAIVVFGRVMLTPALIARCAVDGRSVVWMSSTGRFQGRLEGPVRGNVLLRRAQHLAALDETRTARIARQIVAAKIQNSRQLLLRVGRDSEAEDRNRLAMAAAELADILARLRAATELNVIRGLEGEAARAYFGVFGRMVRVDREELAPDGRTRRPPRDRTNALLSFLYALLRGDCQGALEGVGLDPQVGFLHSLRPGRPALALDLMEELRPSVDRLALALINRRQIRREHFDLLPGGAVYLNEAGRKVVIVAYQERKAEEVEHRALKEKVAWGLVAHVQARLLARYLRGDLAEYPPYLAR